MIGDKRFFLCNIGGSFIKGEDVPSGSKHSFYIDEPVFVLDIHDFIIQRVTFKDIYKLNQNLFFQNIMFHQGRTVDVWTANLAPFYSIFDSDRLPTGTRFATLYFGDKCARGIEYLGGEGLGYSTDNTRLRNLGVTASHNKSIVVMDSLTGEFLFEIIPDGWFKTWYTERYAVAYAYREGKNNFIVNTVMPINADNAGAVFCITEVYDLVKETLVGFFYTTDFVRSGFGKVEVNKRFYMPQLSKNVLRGY